jgi:hypothetical protein
MVATKREIVISENSDFIYRFDYDLKYIKSESLNEYSTPIKCSGLFYDPVNDYLYVFVIGRGFYALDSEFNILKFFEVEIDKDILFYVNNNFEIFLTIISTSETGYYNLNKNNSYETSFKVCKENSMVVSLQGDVNNTLMIGCKKIDFTESEIVIFQYGDTSSISSDDFDETSIIDTLFDSKDRLIFIVKENLNSAYALSLFTLY